MVYKIPIIRATPVEFLIENGWRFVHNGTVYTEKERIYTNEYKARLKWFNAVSNGGIRI